MMSTKRRYFTAAAGLFALVAGMVVLLLTAVGQPWAPATNLSLSAAGLGVCSVIIGVQVLLMLDLSDKLAKQKKE